MRLQEYLENDLGLDGYVYAYSFNDGNGSSRIAYKELGDRDYNNQAHYINKYGKEISMRGKSWLEKARDDFKDWFMSKNGRDPREDEIPQKYIFITHSMGNMPARLYIYSKYIMGNDIYRNDVDKVVFIAPPFCGSDMAYVGLIPKNVLFAGALYMQGMEYKDMWDKINNQEKHLFWIDPYSTYRVSKNAAALAIGHPMMLDTLLQTFGIQVGDKSPDWATISPNWTKASNRAWNPNMILEGSGYGICNWGLWELMPGPLVHGYFNGIMDARLDDDRKEPDYSVVYGKGAPVVNMDDSGIGQAITLPINTAIRTVNYNINSDVINNQLLQNVKDWVGGLNDELLLTASGGFSDLSTTQAKFYSLLDSNKFVAFTRDGDSAVPVSSALGQFGGKSTRSLRDAIFYPKTFTCGFNDFLEKQFPRDFEAALMVYLTVLAVQPAAADSTATYLQWILAADLLINVNNYAAALQDQRSPHTNAMLKDYGDITTALLDSYGILTIQDMQATEELESVASSEEVKHLFTESSPAPGYFSIPIRSFATRDNTDMRVVGPVPITIDGTREYVSQVLITQKPQRVVAKLNYLIPQKLKQFQYSFNFQAWQDVPNLDNFTGLVTFEGLHFAEGQNLLAIRTTNYAGIKYNQLVKVILNSVPLQASRCVPESNYMTNNPYQPISVVFNKTTYYEDEAGKVQITAFDLDGTDHLSLASVTSEIDGAYHRYAKVNYTPSEPFQDGQHDLLVKVQSDVGVSQAIWSFFVDTQPPTISIEVLSHIPPAPPTRSH